MPPALRVHQLGKRYRIRHRSEGSPRYETFREQLAGWFQPGEGTRKEDFWALKDLSFELESGQVLGIIGRNGAGKSTLLKLLARITEPTTGRIELHGRTASLLEVGTGFHPELTGRENIFLNGAILGMTRAEIRSRFDAIVDFAGVERFLDTPVKRYSSGMYVRLAFAVAAHLDPEILIIDEVLAVGDLEFQQKCLGKMRTVVHEGRTVLLVSHQLNTVRQLCGQCLLLDGGEIRAKGEASEVLDSYISDSQASGETTSERHRSWEPSPPVDVRTVTLFSGGTTASRTIPFGEPWEVRVEFLVREPIEDLVVALGIRQTTGLAVQTCWATPESVVPGAYAARFSQDRVQLECNSYRIVVGFSRSLRPILQHEFGIFEILSTEAPASHAFVPPTSGCGIVLNSMKAVLERET